MSVQCTYALKVLSRGYAFKHVILNLPIYSKDLANQSKLSDVFSPWHSSKEVVGLAQKFEECLSIGKATLSLSEKVVNELVSTALSEFCFPAITEENLKSVLSLYLRLNRGDYSLVFEFLKFIKTITIPEIHLLFSSMLWYSFQDAVFPPPVFNPFESPDKFEFTPEESFQLNEEKIRKSVGEISSLFDLTNPKCCSYVNVCPGLAFLKDESFLSFLFEVINESVQGKLPVGSSATNFVWAIVVGMVHLGDITAVNSILKSLQNSFQEWSVITLSPITLKYFFFLLSEIIQRKRSSSFDPLVNISVYEVIVVNQLADDDVVLLILRFFRILSGKHSSIFKKMELYKLVDSEYSFNLLFLYSKIKATRFHTLYLAEIFEIMKLSIVHIVSDSELLVQLDGYLTFFNDCKFLFEYYPASVIKTDVLLLIERSAEINLYSSLREQIDRLFAVASVDKDLHSSVAGLLEFISVKAQRLLEMDEYFKNPEDSGTSLETLFQTEICLSRLQLAKIFNSPVNLDHLTRRDLSSRRLGVLYWKAVRITEIFQVKSMTSTFTITNFPVLIRSLPSLIHDYKMEFATKFISHCFAEVSLLKNVPLHQRKVIAKSILMEIDQDGSPFNWLNTLVHLSGDTFVLWFFYLLGTDAVEQSCQSFSVMVSFYLTDTKWECSASVTELRDELCDRLFIKIMGCLQSPAFFVNSDALLKVPIDKKSSPFGDPVHTRKKVTDFTIVHWILDGCFNNQFSYPVSCLIILVLLSSKASDTIRRSAWSKLCDKSVFRFVDCEEVISNSLAWILTDPDESSLASSSHLTHQQILNVLSVSFDQGSLLSYIGWFYVYSYIFQQSVNLIDAQGELFLSLLKDSRYPSDFIVLTLLAFDHFLANRGTAINLGTFEQFKVRNSEKLSANFMSVTVSSGDYSQEISIQDIVVNSPFQFLCPK
jgi:hypothetical protein